MNIRRNINYFLIITLLIGIMPVTGRAASANRINKVMTVMEDEILKTDSAPKLIITLLDDLEEGDIFYLNLSGAKWVEGEYAGQIKGNTGSALLQLKMISSKELQVKITGDEIKAGASLQISMGIQMTGEKAYVTIKNNNTSVTSGTYLIAESMSHLGNVASGEVPAVTASSFMTELYLEEPFSMAFSKAIERGAENTVQIQINHNGFAFDLGTSQISIEGIKGFEGINAGQDAVRQIDDQTIEVILPDTRDVKYTGTFILKGLKIRFMDKVPELGKITATVTSDLLKEKTLDVLEVTDYGIELTAEKQTVQAGNRRTVSFTLTEKVEDSLVHNRPTYFSFRGGVYLEANSEGKVEVKINGQTVYCDPVIENNKIIGFKVNRLPQEEKVYHIAAELLIPSQVEGEIIVEAEGKSLIEKLQVQLLKVQNPFTVSITPFEVKVGLKDQLGGKIVLTEKDAGSLKQGKSIILKLEESAMKITKISNVSVTKGDIRLGTPVISEGQIEIPVIRRSNTASTIEISDLVITVDQTVANGTYTAQLGGQALSALADEDNLDSIWTGDFLYVGGVSPIIPSIPEINKKQVCFTIGKNTYTIGTEVKLMDTEPYISEGRTLLPIKYVADALGISGGDVLWTHETKTVTIQAEEKVILQIGSRQMTVGDKTYTMLVPPVIKNGRTFVPIAEISRALNIETAWDAAAKIVTFSTYLL